MMSSRTPGDLGIYGFRNRADHSYDSLFVANGAAVKAPRLWDLATRYGKPSIVLGVPGTYPPRPLNGVMVSLLPDAVARERSTRTRRCSAREVEQVVGEYLFDCTNFRTEDKDDLLRQVYEMTDRRFRLADHLLRTKPWELFAMVEMGTDRMHHGFWKDMDAGHRKHEPDGRYADAILDYHRHVDGLDRRACSSTPTTRRPCSSSPTTARSGWTAASAINEWLRREGLLRTRARAATAVARSRDVGVDWIAHDRLGRGRLLRARLPERARPRAGGDGRARATTSASATSSRERLAAIPDDDGEPIGTRVYRPEEVYDEVNGVAPDLIVYFGDLAWRAVGTVGGDEGIHTFENDTGPDDANHAQDGLLIMAGPGVEPGQRGGHAPARRRADRARAARAGAAARDARDEPACGGASSSAGRADRAARLRAVAVLRVPVGEQRREPGGARPGRGRTRRPRRSAAWTRPASSVPGRCGTRGSVATPRPQA